jgi:anaerobic selenocysteine-containing dehydrogenase
LATVEDGKIVRLRRARPLHESWLALRKGKGFIEHVYHPERLNYPLKRIGDRGEGKWQKISWDNALDEIAEKLKFIKENSGQKHSLL